MYFDGTMEGNGEKKMNILEDLAKFREIVSKHIKEKNDIKIEIDRRVISGKDRITVKVFIAFDDSDRSNEIHFEKLDNLNKDLNSHGLRLGNIHFEEREILIKKYPYEEMGAKKEDD